MKIFKKIKDIVSASILCLRFPFLYPRNRFDGKHHCCVLGNLRYKLQEKSTHDIGITATLEKNTKRFPTDWTQVFDNRIKFENDKITIKNNVDFKEFDINKLIWNADKVEILGLYTTFAMTGRLIVHLVVSPIDPEDTTNYGYGYHSLELITNRFIYKLYKFVTWFDTKVLDKILFLPSYTELDAMEPGWRKAFGIQMCKDIRRQLIKERKLFKWRIVQLKEKFGEMRLYSNFASDELYDIIDKYEWISYRTCGDCGKPATKISKGWVYPYCDDCIGDRNFTEIGKNPFAN